MLGAAIDVVNTQPDITPYLKAVLNKAGNYASTRNMIVHGDILFVAYEASKYMGQTIILYGRQHWHADPPESEVLTLEQLKITQENFFHLGAMISFGLNWDGKEEKSPVKFLELIRVLPNPAHSDRLDPNIAKQFPLSDTDRLDVWR